MMKNEKHISTFSFIGEVVEILTSSFDALTEFLCELYGHEENYTDYVHYNLYTLTHSRLEAKAISPYPDSLKFHSSRVDYQAYIRRSSLQQYPRIPLPNWYGREQDGNGVINMKWSKPPATNEIVGMIFYTCRYVLWAHVLVLIIHSCSLTYELNNTVIIWCLLKRS